MRSALVLAGGGSKRFGRPKGFVEAGGRTLIERVATVLQPLVDEVLISVADARMEDRVHGLVPDAILVRDRARGRGPIEGFLRGFERASGGQVFVAPCDAPLLRPELYGLLGAVLGDHEAAVPRFAVVDPVRAVYRRDATLRVLREDRPDVPSPSALVDSLDAVFVEESQIRRVDPSLDSFLDVNEESDLRDVLRRLETRGAAREMRI